VDPALLVVASSSGSRFFSGSAIEPSSVFGFQMRLIALMDQA